MPAVSLKNFPKDVMKYITRLHQETKKRKNIKQYSVYQVIYQVIREHESLFTTDKQELSSKKFVTQMKSLVEAMEDTLKNQS